MASPIDQTEAAKEKAMTATSTTPSVPVGRKVIPRRRSGRIVAVVLLAILSALFVRELVNNPAFQWDVVGKYLVNRSVLDGLVVTLELTVISMTLGIALGVLLAVMRLSTNPVISGVASAYVWFFRGTPLLVQLIFWYNFSALYQHLRLGFPFGGPTFVEVETNSVISAFGAAIVGLSLNEAAYMAEIVRGGMLSVPGGQAEAAAALGMRSELGLRLIVLPQAMRVIIPPTGNQVIGMLKTTSLVSIIATQDLLYSVQLIYGRTFQTIPMLIVACIWYLAITTILSFVQSIIERRYGAGVIATGHPSVFSRLKLLARARRAST